MTLRIVASGTWLYGGSVETDVDVIALDYDWWYSLAAADNHLEPGESPRTLSSEGFLYYVRFRHAGESAEPTWVDSPGHLSVADAKSFADTKVVGGISWRIAHAL